MPVKRDDLVLAPKEEERSKQDINNSVEASDNSKQIMIQQNVQAVINHREQMNKTVNLQKEKINFSLVDR